MIAHEMEHLPPWTRRAGTHCQQESCEVGNAALQKTLGYRHARRSHQRTAEIDRAQAALAIGSWHRRVRHGCCRGTSPLARLDRSRLIDTHEGFAQWGELLGLFIPLERRAGVLHTRRVSRLLPGMGAPGFDLVLTPPASDSTGGHRGDETWRHGRRGESLATLPWPHLPRRLGLGAGQRHLWRPHHRGQDTRDTRPGPVCERGRPLPALPPHLDGLQAAADGVGDVAVHPIRMQVSQQQEARVAPGHRAWCRSDAFGSVRPLASRATGWQTAIEVLA